MTPDKIDYIGYTGGVLLTLNMVPQFIYNWKKNDSSGLSVGFLVMNISGLSLYLVYGLAKNIYPISIPIGASLLISLSLGGLKFYHKYKSEEL